MIAIADVDRLRVFNDMYGHRPGDELLSRLARIFAGVALVVVYHHGDEFRF